MAQGSYNRPKLPGIPGIKDFKGHVFHSARWDYDYTGGDANGGLHKLARQARRARRHRRDRRAAGSAPGPGCQAPLRLSAHAVIGRRARQRADRPAMGGVAAARLAGGAQAQLPPLVTVRGCGVRASRIWSATSGPNSGRNMTARIAASRRSRIADASSRSWRSGKKKTTRSWSGCGAASTSIVDDPETAEALKPYYRFMCKRPCSNDEYLPTFNRPNVTLVDVSESKGVERLTENGHRRQRRRVRSRLRHLRQRLRDLHRDQPSVRDRRHRGP